MTVYYPPHIEVQLFRLTLYFLSQSFQLFQALRNGKRSTASFIVKWCAISTNCPFSNLKETDVCNSVRNCSALLCASPFCALPGGTSPPPPCWLSASREKTPGWASPIILCLAAEHWGNPAQSWPHGPAAAPGHTWELPALLHSAFNKSGDLLILISAEMHGQIEGKDSQTWNLPSKAWRYLGLTNTTVTEGKRRDFLQHPS